jgi:hypothetical protein
VVERLEGALRRPHWLYNTREPKVTKKLCDVKHCIDIYKGWVVAFVDGQWRHVHIEPGWVTFARWDEPNQHIGIVREGAVDEAGARNVEELATSPHALVAGPVSDPDVLERLAYVRFGRAKTLNPIELMADGEMLRAIAKNLDNSKGLLSVEQLGPSGEMFQTR